MKTLLTIQDVVTIKTSALAEDIHRLFGDEEDIEVTDLGSYIAALRDPVLDDELAERDKDAPTILADLVAGVILTLLEEDYKVERFKS